MRNLVTTIGALTALALLTLLPATGQAGELEKKMIGYWAPNPEAMMEEIKKQLGDDPNAAAALPLIQAMMANMAIEVKKGEVIIHAMGEKQVATYTITKEDAATKTITMKVKDDEGESEGTAKIDGDKLTLSKEGENILLNRIKKEDFEKRKKAAAQPPAIPGLE